MSVLSKMKNTKLIRESGALWRLTNVVDNIELSKREKLFGRLEIAYRILRVTTITHAIRRKERVITRHKNGLLLYNISVDEGSEETEHEQFHNQEDQLLVDNSPVHRN